MNERISTLEQLVLLEAGSVLRGPDWHGEVYVKVGDVEFVAPGSETPYLARELVSRGPFTVLFKDAA